MADKSLTIKTASDKELDDLIVRLRKENEVQDLVGALKRKGSASYVPYDAPQISTEEPIQNLYHYGILGMHWGRRKGKDSTTTVVRTHTSEDHDKRMALKGKKLSELSNDELRSYTQRMLLEKQFKELSKADMTRTQKFVNEAISRISKGATDAALNYATKEASKMVEELLKKAKTAAT
jgi:hypothetical protein